MLSDHFKCLFAHKHGTNELQENKLTDKGDYADGFASLSRQKLFTSILKHLKHLKLCCILASCLDLNWIVQISGFA